MLTNRPAVLIAVVAGALASSVAFMSDAGAEDRRAEYAPIRLATAVFAGGDFRGIEADFDQMAGVIETVSGYTGGTLSHPTHKQVISGESGHYEAVKVTYDPSRISYEALAANFIRAIDPTDDAGQFCDKGESYRSAIFVSGQSERTAAVATISNAQRALGTDIVTEIRPLTDFWPAAEPYQDYHLRNASKYAGEREACGRDQRLMEIWGSNAAGL